METIIINYFFITENIIGIGNLTAFNRKYLRTLANYNVSYLGSYNQSLVLVVLQNWLNT